ncbi:MAG: TPM domain-containing protein [Lachnospiraceae bacterium]|nr:TPM domain-containing protein [Lachnospiraceae bacterium]
MREYNVVKLGILICSASIVIVGILYAWETAKEKQNSYMDNMSEYDAETEDVGQDFFDADEIYLNAETSYRVLIEDDAQLLDDEEEQALTALMQEITAYGNVAFKTIDDNNYHTEFYARQYYQKQFGTDSGTLFLIDMDNRNIWIHSDGDVYTVITKSYADTITDNVYRYASGGDYYDCAAQTYDQILTLLKGNKIAQPMKYISNGLLAVILALLLNYGLVSFFARIRKTDRKELLRNGRNHFNYTQPRAFFIRESRMYHPTSSGSSSGSSGGGSSSGGGGGSSSSGGGGRHSF